MSNFSYDSKNEKLYLVYNADVTEVIDGYTLGIIINNPIDGLARVMFSNDINGKIFTYDITGTIKLKDLLTKGVNERLYFSMLVSVAKTLHECEKHGLNVGSLILNEELLYCDEEKGVVYFVCIPTSGFIVSIDSKEILRQFSTVLMNRMEVTNSTILEINEYLTLMDSEYVYADFIYKLNQYMLEHNIESPNVVKKTRQTVYKEEPKKTRKPEDNKLEAQNYNEESVSNNINVLQNADNIGADMTSAVDMAPVVPNNMINDNAEKPKVLNVIKDKTQDVIKAIVSVKDKIKVSIKEKKSNLANNNQNIAPGMNPNMEMQNMALGMNPNMEVQNMVPGMNPNMEVQNMVPGMNLNMEMQNMVPGMNPNMEMRNIVSDVNQNMVIQNAEVGNNSNDIQENSAYGQMGESSSTLMLDCVTGETENGNSISTAEPYLLRVSTGEKISVTRTNFKLGRSKKRADYFVGDNDTISKVHAFITKTNNQYFIVDNGSSNRTYLDGQVLEPIKQNRLRHKSKIKLAKEEFVFYLY